MARPRRLATCLLLAFACGGDDDDRDRPVVDGGGSTADAAGETPDAGPAAFPGSWELALLARCNFAVNESGAYRIPPGHFVDGPAVQVNRAGQVAVTVPIAPDGRRHLWLGDESGGGLVYHSPDNPVFAGGPSINDRGDVAFACGLAPVGDDQLEWGTGIYLAAARP